MATEAADLSNMPAAEPPRSAFEHFISGNVIHLRPEDKELIENWVTRLENAARTTEDASWKIEAAVENFGSHVTRIRTGN